MSELVLTFLKPGLLTSIQDNGRTGHQAFGVPVGGALDKTSARAANRILGLNDSHPVLEITLLGPEIHFSTAAEVAITGADFPVKLNGSAVAFYERILVPANSILNFGHVTNGCRAYMSIAADWQVEQWLGSVSSLGMGSNILADNIISRKQQLVKLKTLSVTHTTAAKVATIKLNPMKSVRLHKGPEFDYLGKAAIASLFGNGHKISRQASRMGYQLETILPVIAENMEIISSGILPGTVQVTPAGHPIILLADAQTTGGYPRVASIIEADLDVIAQLKPGDEVWFDIY